jgi:DinB superfamily
MDSRIDVLLEMLTRYRTELSEALEKVPVDRREIRSGAAWSAANVLEHLASTERAVAALISRCLAEAAPRSESDVFDRARFDQDIDVRQFLDRSVRIKGSQPSGLLSASEAWQTLEASRLNLLGVMDGARGRRLEDFARSHPTGQELNGYQWLAFLAVHEGRHAAQLEEIARSLVTL